jgi:hypothetical protein
MPLFADLVLLNARIFTCFMHKPWASAMAVVGERIAAVGTDADIRSMIGRKTTVLDAGGRLVVPGFNDAHVHMKAGGQGLLGVQLREAHSREDFARRLASFASRLPAGTWITGGSWDHETWPEKTYPDRWLIDAHCPDHPVLLYRVDLHLAVANSLALHLAGIDRSTPDPPGGVIERDEAGEPTGILKDAAIRLVKRAIPSPSLKQRQLAIEAAIRHALSLGVTSVRDMSANGDLGIYQTMNEQGRLGIRVSAVLDARRSLEELGRIGLPAGFGDPYLRLGGVKIFTDGSMGARTGLFTDPYSDAPNTSGVAVLEKHELMRLVRLADLYGMQLNIHAIGDRANRWALDALEAGWRPDSRQRRHRIEHVQVLHPLDLTRFSRMGIVASVQPSHCLADMPWAEQRIGKERCRWAYRLRSLVSAGIPVAFGTDWPVEDLNPLRTLFAAVTRRLPQAEPGPAWYPEERISLEEAIRLYTLGSAYAEQQENRKGSLVPGKLADFVVLNGDLFSLPADEWLGVGVDTVVVGGTIRFSSGKTM